jgi:hypothetical protein
MPRSFRLQQTKPEPGPNRPPLRDRADNGSRSSRGSGPSSGVRKDNPHKSLRIARHAT